MTRGFGWVEVAHGITMADLDRAARIAIATSYNPGGDINWRYQTAWSAIAETVWTAEETPTIRSLAQTGIRAVDRAAVRELHHHGHTPTGAMPAAVAYWWDMSTSSPSPERGVVESIALGQILAALPPISAATIHALAVHDTYPAAAAALNISLTAFHQRLKNARAQFLTLWHEGEEPSATWRHDRRTPNRKGKPDYHGEHRHRVPPAHGTVQRRSRYRCECDPCVQVKNSYVKQGRTARFGTPVKTVTESRFADILADQKAGMSQQQLRVKYRISPALLVDLLRGDRIPTPDEQTAA